MNIRRQSYLAAVALVLLLAGIVAYRYTYKNRPMARSRTVGLQVPQRGQTVGDISVSSSVFSSRAVSKHGDGAQVMERPGHSQESDDLLLAIKGHSELGLTKEEVRGLLKVYVAVSVERSCYEASIASVKVVNPNECIISVPAYPEEGQELEKKLYQGFTSVVGKNRIGLLKEALGPTLYARNYGFGAVEQQIVVTLAEGEPVRFTFAHSAGELKVPYDGAYLTVKYGGQRSTLSVFDLGGYSGYINLLPKGGS